MLGVLPTSSFGIQKDIPDRVVKKTGENGIILMHDYYDPSATAALKVADELLKEAYTFVTVEEILFE